MGRSGWRARISPGSACSASPHRCASQGASLVLLPAEDVYLGKPNVGQHTELLAAGTARGAKLGLCRWQEAAGICSKIFLTGDFCFIFESLHLTAHEVFFVFLFLI